VIRNKAVLDEVFNEISREINLRSKYILKSDGGSKLKYLLTIILSGKAQEQIDCGDAELNRSGAAVLNDIVTDRRSRLKFKSRILTKIQTMG